MAKRAWEGAHSQRSVVKVRAILCVRLSFTSRRNPYANSSKFNRLALVEAGPLAQMDMLFTGAASLPLFAKRPGDTGAPPTTFEAVS
jgi:hypothetical protein